MKTKISIRATTLLLFSLLALGATGAVPRLLIEPGVEVSWPTTNGNKYQLQSSTPSAVTWADLGPEGIGNGTIRSYYEPASNGSFIFRVLETVPGTVAAPLNPVNGGFESGIGASAAQWSATGGQPPARIATDAHSGGFSMRCAVTNVGSSPSEGLLSQLVVAQGGTVTAGQSYTFSFWAKQISSGPSYVQQYQLQWLNSSNGVISGTGLQNFTVPIEAAGTWTKVTPAPTVAPATAVEARISFRFVTGAVSGGSGEVLIDDVELDSGSGSTPGSPAVTNTLPLVGLPVAKINWLSTAGTSYQAASSVNLATWTQMLPVIIGDGNMKSIIIPMTPESKFFRLEIPVTAVLPPTNLQTAPVGGVNSIGLAWTGSASAGVTGYRLLYGASSENLNESIDVGNVTSASISNLMPGQLYFISVVALAADGQSLASDAVISATPSVESGFVALYNSSTILEAPTSVVTASALITRISDRARDRHGREAVFHSYDHYLSWYWEQRMANMEIIDRVGRNGGTNITFNYTTQAALSAAEFRTFFRGIGTVAEYHNNQIASLVSTNPSATPGETDFNYTANVNSNAQFNRPLQVGDRIEIELSQFIAAPRNGRNNYYGTVLLYIVGQGIVPWGQGQDMGFSSGIVGSTNQSLDSYPLPEKAWLGGKTTLPYQYSNEPEHRFKQTAGNISPTNGIPFMLGRRLHHTDFGTGAHSEPNNPLFSQQIGKLGPKFIARSCVECHTNNGRALPPAIGAPMLQTVVRVGVDAVGSPHPALGSVLQPRAASGPIEGSVTLSSYTNFPGQYGDGAVYSLQKPNYIFQSITPAFFSARLAPPLVGLGLLEAVAETTISALADPTDANQDGISGRMRLVTDPETGQQRLGRFTSKAGLSRISHQIAAALNTDMGVTTTVFPKLDGELTAGVAEVSNTELDQMTRYVALLGVGARRDLSDTQALRGEQLFTSAQCVKCHTPDLTTSPYHPMSELRSQTIHPYTDLLLHDMGSGLADTMGEIGASGAEWRTPPLWGIGLTAGVSGGEAYLHDGRARSLEEAILWHGGEAETSKEVFRNLPPADRAAIIKFLKSL